ELEARVLQVEERLAESSALLRIARGDGERLLRRGRRAQRDLQPLVRKLLHHLGKTAPLGGAEQVGRGNSGAVEVELAGVLAVHPDLLERPADAVAGE